MNRTHSPIWLYPLAIPISAFYGAILRLRNRFYDLGLFHSFSSPIPVLSIGSITAGGAGKTPLSIWTISKLLHSNHKVGYLARGYKRHSQGTFVVSDGNQLKTTSVNESGDEPMLIARQFPSICVVCDEDRVNGAHQLAELGCNVIVLDDGFQHRRLKRTADWVILDTTLPRKAYRLLPLGYLREGFQRVSHSQLIWLRCNLNQNVEEWIQRIRVLKGFETVPIQPFEIISTGFRSIEKHSFDLVRVESKRVVAFAGIAHPKRFLHQLQKLNCDVVHWLEFSDHHMYQDRELKKLIEIFEQNQADYIITTEKDMVRLPSFMKQFPILSLIVEVKLFGTQLDIDEQLQTLTLTMRPQ